MLSACEVQVHLVDQLLRRARLLSDVSRRLSALSIADGCIPTDERFELLASILAEARGSREEWQVAYRRLVEHKKMHGC